MKCKLGLSPGITSADAAVAPVWIAVRRQSGVQPGDDDPRRRSADDHYVSTVPAAVSALIRDTALRHRIGNVTGPATASNPGSIVHAVESPMRRTRATVVGLAGGPVPRRRASDAALGLGQASPLL